MAKPVCLADAQSSIWLDSLFHCLDSLSIAAEYESGADARSHVERPFLKFIIGTAATYNLDSIRQSVRCQLVSCPLTEFLGDVYTDAGNAEVRVTTSQGVASFPANGRDIRTVREKADEALYRAKEAGRNRVVCADPVPV